MSGHQRSSSPFKHAIKKSKSFLTNLTISKDKPTNDNPTDDDADTKTAVTNSYKRRMRIITDAERRENPLNLGDEGWGARDWTSMQRDRKQQVELEGLWAEIGRDVKEKQMIREQSQGSLVSEPKEPSRQEQPERGHTPQVTPMRERGGREVSGSAEMYHRPLPLRVSDQDEASPPSYRGRGSEPAATTMPSNRQASGLAKTPDRPLPHRGSGPRDTSSPLANRGRGSKSATPASGSGRKVSGSAETYYRSLPFRVSKPRDPPSPTSYLTRASEPSDFAAASTQPTRDTFNSEFPSQGPMGRDTSSSSLRISSHAPIIFDARTGTEPVPNNPLRRRILPPQRNIAPPQPSRYNSKGVRVTPGSYLDQEREQYRLKQREISASKLTENANPQQREISASKRSDNPSPQHHEDPTSAHREIPHRRRQPDNASPRKRYAAGLHLREPSSSKQASPRSGYPDSAGSRAGDGTKRATGGTLF